MAALLGRDGHRLVLFARNQADRDRVADEFRDRHGGSVETVAADLSRAETSNDMVGELERRGIAVDVLVNNAGFAGYGPYAESAGSTNWR